ncbi:MAG TPA: ABC transporter permease [Thermoanaerobaculia bacterium]|jgi:ABC-2 type transport system permease protein|nr:ABC transporter permease [Thermoanaerobaculia bacterium]
MLAVIRREYLQAVRKKMFIVMTFLFPILMAGAFTLPSLMMAKSLSGRRIAVVDGTGRLREAFTHANEEAPKPRKPEDALKQNRDMPTPIDVDYLDGRGSADLDAQAKPYLDRMASQDKKNRLDGVLVVPKDTLTATEGHMKYYSRSATDFIAQERLSSIANRAIQKDRLTTRGLSADEIERLTARVAIDPVQLSKTGEQKSGGIANFIVGFILAALVLIPSFVYGLEIMRGIIQEKTDRVVEVLISSMTPAQLLIGKILGVALVGLTQVGVWLLMLAIIAGYGTAMAMAATGVNILGLLHASTFIYFVIFFLLAYLTYVCVYAIAGAICNSEKEAQQLIAPISMLMMIPWFLMAAIITNPESSIAVGFSLSPVFGPLTMFVRTLVSEPPAWHVALSIAVSIATICCFFWVTAKIFRVGILSYGKRPTLPELWRWLKVA